MNKVLVALIACVFISTTSCVPNYFYRNQGKSISEGKVNEGAVTNAYQFPRKEGNMKFFSYTSYYLFGRAYVHSSVYTIVMDAYKEMEKTHPEKKWRLAECSRRKGGRMFPHRTHQNGTSVDFMTPLLKNGRKQKLYDGLGMYRYLMNFDDEGHRHHGKVKIDYNTMAEHIMTLEKNARKNGMRIKKVIFRIELKDDLFASEKGRLLKKTNIYFAEKLPRIINAAHDDHYHVDFEFLK